MGEVFFDTNILFYAFDSSEPEKQAKAQGLIADSVLGGTGHSSVQVLGEFFHATVIRKKTLTSDEAEAIIRSLGGLRILDIDYPLSRKVIENHRRFQTSYWDSLVLSAAQRTRCAIHIQRGFQCGSGLRRRGCHQPFRSIGVAFPVERGWACQLPLSFPRVRSQSGRGAPSPLSDFPMLPSGVDSRIFCLSEKRNGSGLPRLSAAAGAVGRSRGREGFQLRSWYGLFSCRLNQIPFQRPPQV